MQNWETLLNKCPGSDYEKTYLIEVLILSKKNQNQKCLHFPFACVFLGGYPPKSSLLRSVGLNGVP